MKYYTYDNLPFSIFINVVNTGEFKLLARSKFYDLDKCLSVWQKIMEENASVSGNNKMTITADSIKAYVRYSANYVSINAMLIVLQYKVNAEYIKTLMAHGYIIHSWDNTLTQQQNNSKYANSIQAAFSKLRNIGSKIESKKKEIASLTKTSQNESTRINFGEMIAIVSARLGFQLRHNILLSEYNAFVKSIKSKK